PEGRRGDRLVVSRSASWRSPVGQSEWKPSGDSLVAPWTLGQERDDDREETDTFDEGRRQDHRAADVARGVRLASDALDRGRGDAADSPRGAERGETSAESSSDR